MSLGWVGDLSVASVATDPIVEDWHLAPSTWHLLQGVRCQVTGGPEGFSVFLSWVGVLSVPSVATEPIIKDWHLALVLHARDTPTDIRPLQPHHRGAATVHPAGEAHFYAKTGYRIAIIPGQESKAPTPSTLTNRHP